MSERDEALRDAAFNCLGVVMDGDVPDPDGEIGQWHLDRLCPIIAAYARAEVVRELRALADPGGGRTTVTIRKIHARADEIEAGK